MGFSEGANVEPCQPGFHLREPWRSSNCRVWRKLGASLTGHFLKFEPVDFLGHPASSEPCRCGSCRGRPTGAGEGRMRFETLSLLLNWVQLGVLLGILSRVGRTFDLIANTQRELRRAIRHLAEHRRAELSAADNFGRWGTGFPPRSSPGHAHIDEADDDLAHLSP